ncbi:MAG: molybdopterin cofactor-binding domain-containing protein [Candidatus Promineifilaceae bacterium]
MSEQKPKRRWRVTRRGFLIGLGTTGVLAAGGVAFGLPVAQRSIAGFLDQGSAPFGVDAPPTSWFEVTNANQVILHVPKAEMGQGIHTALGQIAAEELGISWDQLIIQQASTLRGPNDSGGTGGSGSVAALFTPLREAAATLRVMLAAKAGEKLAVAPDSLTLVNGVFSTASGESLSYGEVVEGVSEWEVPEEAPALKPRSEWKFIGKAAKRVDFEAKLTGQPVYGLDARLPNMLFGAIVRPNTIEGKIISAEAGKAADMPGVVDIIIEDDFVAVVAETRYQADLARNNLQIEWDEGKLWQQEELDEIVTVGNGKGVVIQKEGDAQGMLSGGRTVIAEYRTPMAAHAHLEPQAALVDVQPDKVQAFVSTQFPDTARTDVAAVLGVDAGIVDLKATYLGGGFGRKLNSDIAVEAAKLSQRVGRPVHVGYNRREEFRNGFLRPSTHNILKASLDDNGNLLAIEHQQASGDVAFPFFPSFLVPVMGVDFGAWRGSRFHYGFENMRAVAWRTKLPVATGWWRGLGLLANVFAIESFIDEVAHAAGRDPLEFRLSHLGSDGFQPKIRGVLEAVAEAADWGGPVPEGRARGIACSIDVQTPCAQIAEVSMQDGQLRIHKVWAAVDPGVIINPDGVMAQTQGAIIQGLSSVLFEKITVKNGKIEAVNFNKYPLITMKEAPEIEVVMLETGDVPTGMGEPPMGPIGAAVGNAIFALTGQRIRELPLQLA